MPAIPLLDMVKIPKLVSRTQLWPRYSLIGILLTDEPKLKANVGANVLVLIDDRQISVKQQEGSVEGPVLEGVVDSVQFHGGESDLVVRIGNGRLSCLVRPGDASMALAVGESVSVVVPPHAVRLVHLGQ